MSAQDALSHLQMFVHNDLQSFREFFYSLL
jgi:hypothetical protein